MQMGSRYRLVSIPPRSTTSHPVASSSAISVLTPQTIFVFPDTQQKHIVYDDQVIQTFYLSHADATDMAQILSAIIRLPGIPVQPIIQVNKASNTITCLLYTSDAADD